MSDNTQLRNKVIVITGASTGFGRGTALAFAEAGARLVIAARSRNHGNQAERTHLCNPFLFHPKRSS